MQLEVLKQKVNKKLDLLHSENITLKVLYDAIENCSNEAFSYNRHIVRDMFEGNESLIEKQGERWYYVHTWVEWTYDPSETAYERLIRGINEDLFNKTDEEINDWVEIGYKRFVFMYFVACLGRLDALNEDLF